DHMDQIAGVVVRREDVEADPGGEDRAVRHTPVELHPGTGGVEHVHPREGQAMYAEQAQRRHDRPYPSRRYDGGDELHGGSPPASVVTVDSGFDKLTRSQVPR